VGVDLLVRIAVLRLELLLHERAGRLNVAPALVVREVKLEGNGLNL
jgi:hypothetical protein